MFANEFFEAWTMTPILTVSTVFSTLSLFLGAQFTASKRSDLHLKSNLIAMTTNVALNYILIKWLGINGAAYGTMISYFIVMIYRHIKINELIDFKTEVIKMYFICCLLMLASTIISLKIRESIVVTALFFFITIFIYGKNIVSIIQELYMTFLMKLRKKS